MQLHCIQLIMAKNNEPQFRVIDWSIDWITVAECDQWITSRNIIHWLMITQWLILMPSSFISCVVGWSENKFIVRQMVAKQQNRQCGVVTAVRRYCDQACLFVCLSVSSFVHYACVDFLKHNSPILMKFGTLVQHLRQMYLLTFRGLRSKFNVKKCHTKNLPLAI